jgi:hypothetical protein
MIVIGNHLKNGLLLQHVNRGRSVKKEDRHNCLNDNKLTDCKTG